MMEKTYYLDLPTLLGYVRGKAAILRTTVTLAKNQPACQGSLFLLNANTRHCYILSSKGQLLFEGEEAYKRLSQCNEWMVRMDVEPVVRQEWLAWLQQHRLNFQPFEQTRAEPALIPQPKKALEAHMLRQFSHPQMLFLRTVFALVNGQRSVEQIKARLPQASPQAIDDALNILRTLGAIE
jgi:hypothetical protein